MTVPPRAHIATALLTFLLPREDVETIVGDLEEEDVARRSTSGSARWYWAQLVRSVPALLWLPIHRGGWRSTVGVALAACAIQAAIEVTTGFAVRELAPSGGHWPAFVALVITLTSLALVSYMAAKVREGAATAVAGVAVFAIAVQVMLAAQMHRGLPIGLLAALVVVPGTALIGGALSSKTCRR
jgi:hypothetical protein